MLRPACWKNTFTHLATNVRPDLHHTGVVCNRRSGRCEPAWACCCSGVSLYDVSCINVRGRLVGQHVFFYSCLCCHATMYALLHTKLSVLNSWTDLSKALKTRLCCDSCSSALALFLFIYFKCNMEQLKKSDARWRRLTTWPRSRGHTDMGVSIAQRSRKYTYLVSTFVDNSDFRIIHKCCGNERGVTVKHKKNLGRFSFEL